VTATDTVATSYMGISSSIAASAAEAAVKRKEAKYIEICRSHHFFPIAIETFGLINEVGLAFISALGHRISLVTDDPRETLFNALTQSASQTHLAILANNLLTNRDAHSLR